MPDRPSILEQEHEDFRAVARAFFNKEVVPFHEQWERDGIVDREVWRRAGERGLLCFDVEETYGGPGIADFRYNMVLAEESARAGASGPGFAVHTDIIVPYISSLGTEEQKQRWLPGCVSGDLVTAIAMTEPGAGSDLQGIRTTAVDAGDHYVLNGSKTFISNGILADLVVVVCRTDPQAGHRGISLFGVDTSADGFSVGRVLDKVGQDESNTAELAFDDVRVSNDDLIGELDTGFIAMMKFLPQERLGSAVTNLAHAAQILDETVTYAKERKAFGQPIGSFQNTQFLLADLVTKVEVTQAYVDRCVVAHTQGELTAVDAAKAKWWTSQVQNDVLDHCVQVFGGYGYMNEYRVARAWRDARVTKIWAGSNEIMKMLIARDLGL